MTSDNQAQGCPICGGLYKRHAIGRCKESAYKAIDRANVRAEEPQFFSDPMNRCVDEKLRDIEKASVVYWDEPA